MGSKASKKEYSPPKVFSASAPAASVLLICTGQYNCFDEVGYDCCQPTSATCVNSC